MYSDTRTVQSQFMYVIYITRSHKQYKRVISATAGRAGGVLTLTTSITYILYMYALCVYII